MPVYVVMKEDFDRAGWPHQIPVMVCEDKERAKIEVVTRKGGTKLHHYICGVPMKKVKVTQENKANS